MLRRPNFAAIHARNDAIAWTALRARPIPKSASLGMDASGRPANYLELAEAVDSGQDYAFAFDHFLDEFYLFRSESFFAKEPPTFFGPKRAAFLAAVAEFLCREFSLPIPEWTEKPRYFLADEWDWEADLDGFPEELRDRIEGRRDRATPEFLRRNILYRAHNLIRL